MTKKTLRDIVSLLNPSINEEVMDKPKRSGDKVNQFSSWYTKPGAFEKVKEMDEQGQGHRIAQHFGVSKQSVVRAFKYFNMKHGYTKNNPLENRKQTLMKMDQDGESIGNIATTLNIDKKSVKTHLKRLADKGYKRTERKAGRKSLWNDDNLAELNKHLENPHTSYHEISSRMNVDKRTIIAAIRVHRNKLPNANIARIYTAPKGPKWLTPEKKETLIKMDQEKKSYNEIGTKLGQAKYTIQTALKLLAKHEGYKRTDRSENVAKNRKLIGKFGKGRNKGK